MRLSYRGVSYEYNPVTTDSVESTVTGQYRGRHFNFAYPRHIPVPQPVANLNYRGVPYRTTATGKIEAIAPTPKASSPATRMTGRHTWAGNQTRIAIMDEVARIHRQNIEMLLQHRIEVARAKGDQTLLQQLENEMRQTA